MSLTKIFRLYKMAFLILGILGFMMVSAQAEDSSPPPAAAGLEQSVGMISNASEGGGISQAESNQVQSVLDQNAQLANGTEELQRQIRQLTNEKMSAEKSAQELQKERDILSTHVSKLRKDNNQLSRSNKVAEAKLAKRNLELSSRFQSKPQQLAQNRSDLFSSSEDQSSEEFPSQDEIIKREQKTSDILSKIDAYNEENEDLRKDAAKAHYNMGNIYFEKGEYELSVREYYQAVNLLPDDPDAHFNLAFVSGEYLDDQQTALKHYQIYMYLKPSADDLDFVRERIIAAQLAVRSRIDSPIDKEVSTSYDFKR